ncbi:MAG TPA: FUSC family protein [Candidatus Sulfotelmatobacter sp.]|nr:FUSC family protein [Candidatus Sulfotelmatobacter sp.]
MVIPIKWLDRLIGGDWLGIHFAVNIFIATTLLWLILNQAAGLNPIWAISSMVAASDPVVRNAVSTFRGRIINALLGCAVGFAFLVFGGSGEWKLPLALAVTVLLSTYVVRVQVMWRQAPITAAVVIAAGMTHSSKLTAVEIGVRRVGEVLLGCVVGIVISWLMSIIWTPPEPKKKGDSSKSTSAPDQIARTLPTSEP